MSFVLCHLCKATCFGALQETGPVWKIWPIEATEGMKYMRTSLMRCYEPHVRDRPFEWSAIYCNDLLIRHTCLNSLRFFTLESNYWAKQGNWWNLLIHAFLIRAIMELLFLEREEANHWKVNSSGLPRPMENLSIELDDKTPTQTPFPFTSRKAIVL